MSTTRRRYRFGPLEQRGTLGPLRIGQLAVLAPAAIAGLGSLYLLRGAAGLLLALALFAGAAAAVLLPVAGRTLEQWAPLALRWATRSTSERRGYRSTSPMAGARAREGEIRHEPSLPPGLAGLQMLALPYGTGEVGVICEPAAGTYTAALAVRAGPFGLCDGAEQERKLDGWGAVLASLAREGSPISRLQWIERTLPAQADELAAHLQANRDRTLAPESGLVSSYIELIESAAPASTEHEILLALQVSERRAARELRRLGGGREAACALLVREAEGLAERLSLADVSVLGLLRPRRYAAAIRDAYDPYGRAARARAALGTEREGVEPALMGPLAEESGWRSHRTDGAHHATYWVSAWPRTDVGAAFLAPLLLQTRALRSVAVCMEPVPHTIAMRRAEAARTAEVAEEMARERQGFMTTARTRRRQQASERREEELADGHAEMRFAGYLTVSAPDQAELEQSATEIEHAAALSRLELQRLYGEQEEGFAFTLPLCRGLR